MSVVVLPGSARPAARSPARSPARPYTQRGGNATPLWLRLIQEAEAAAAAAGASLWYVPPSAYADRSVNGPFVGSDGSGGVPAVGSGVVGWLRDRRGGPLGTELAGPLDQAPWGTLGSLSAVTANSFTNSSGGGAGRRLVTIAGAEYEWSLTFTKSDASTLFSVSLDSATGAPAGSSTAASGTLSGRTISTGHFYLRLGGDATVTFSSLSVRQVPGNNATQSTSANRPVLVAAPGAAASAAGFGALLYDSSNDGLFIPAPSALGGDFSFVAAVSLPSLIGNRRLIQRGQTGHFTVQIRGAQLFVSAVGVNEYLAYTIPATGSYVFSFRVVGNSVETRANGQVVDSRVPGYAPFTTPTGQPALGSTDGSAEPLNGTAGAFAIVPGTGASATFAIERLGAYIVGAPYPGL